jgi:hypothetical protein
MKSLVSAGPRGLALLGATGIVGVVLAVHGWAHHTTAGPLGSLNGGTASRSGAAATAATSTPPTAGPSVSSNAGASTGPTSAPTPGPLLTSQPFAQYSFAIWPGTPNANAKAALTGLSVHVHSQGSGLSITAAVNGQPAAPAHFYPGGAHVYVVEATMGDDSGASDYNLGDDGIVVTDVQGRIIS